MQRVVITGMGAVTPLGNTAAASWAAMREGHSAIGPIRSLAADSLRAGIAAEVAGFDPAGHFDDKRLILLDRFTQFALVAAREAIAQSGIAFEADGLGTETAVVIGTGIGGEQTHDAASRRLYRDGNPRAHPLTIVRLMANAPASHIAIEFGLNGPAFATSSACASSNHALAQAFQMVRSGSARAAVAGGSEACITLGVVRAWEAMRVMADDTCRPFCLQRRGMVLGEGAAVFVLETLQDAQRRGADILAELAGAGMSADAGDVVFPSAEGAALAIGRALDDASLAPADVDYINAHGTGTPGNDPTETAAIRRAFGASADRLAVSSTKSMHAHALGAAGAIELVATIGALRE
jgi:nodulation protein E